ncbi:MAG: BACON domain-containing protein, partial [Prevotella sp.]|nr:BACON domain-containing protein [Prevotella sp.]
NVYGGNEHTDVGMYTGTNLTEPLAEGKCTINMTGGTLGVPRTAEAMSAYPLTGYIFGAGKGDPRIFFNTWTNVINTEVKISGTARIYGSTFGGGEDGHVIRDAVTNIGGTVNIDLNGDGDTTDNGETFTENGMIIGTTGTSYVDGNVFGGGRGFSGEAQTAGTVGGNVKVNIYGGTMLGSIYGGGRLASVGTQFTTPEDDNYGNFLEDSEPTYYTQAECDTYNATLAGAQVASGEITAEAANAYNATLEGARTTNDIKHYNIYGHVTINISGGTIGNATLTGNETGAEHSGNVFGGSMGRLNLLNGNRNPIWPKMAQVKTAAVNIYNKAVIRRNVYGGSELGTVRNNASVVIGGYLNPSVTDGCKAEDFKLTPTAADSTFTVSTYTDSENHAVYPIVGRDVYGGGYGSENDDTHTIFTVKEPDENNVFQKNTYAFTPMQFAGCVGQNTFVNILGGYVRKSVYGGGEMASVGIFNCRVDSTQTEPEADKVRVGYNTNTNYYYYYKNFRKHSYAENGFALSWPYDFEYVPTFEGATHINITAGRLGLKESTDENNFEENNKDNGDVYGGGKGIAGEYEKYVFCANVGSTEVNIDFTNDENKTLDPATYMNIGDCIAGAVYGGAENGHVIRDTHVTLTDGLIGHAIYGGGSGKGQFKKWLTMIPEDNRKPITNTGSGTAPNINGDQYEAICYSITAGKVFGNTNVTMKDGYVVRNIYGGGTLGSVGKGNYAGGTDDFSYYVSPAKTYNGYGEALQGSLWDNTTDNATTNKFSTAFLNSGKCTVTITGGTVGYIASDPSKSIKDGLPYGNVFGGCRGASAPNIGESPRYLYSPEFFLGYVNETEVTIGTNGATTGPKILGSVYGGGQDGHVRRDTHVTINSGEIGLAYDQETTAKTNVTKLGTANLDDSQWLARGNVYGAGSGISEYNYDFNYDGDYDDVVTYINPQTGRPSTMKETDLSTSAGSVTRFTQVDITGGIIHRNVYGGGSLASVGPPKIPPTRPDDGDNPKDVTQNRPGHQTLNLVNISSTIGTPDGYAPDIYSGNDSFKYNSVYGGEVYGASRGTDPDNTSLATSIWTEVNLLPGAHVLNNVFGGGDNGMVKQDAVVNVGLPVNITPTSLSFTQKNNESKTITVGFDAPWTAESSANWLTVTPSGTGAGTITVTAADNLPEEVGDTVSARTATITIKGIFGQRNVTVTQAGGN